MVLWPCYTLSLSTLNIGSRSNKGIWWGYQLKGPQRQWRRAGLGTGFPEHTWTQQAPQPRSLLLRGDSWKQLSSRPWASSGAKSGEKRPQAPASGCHDNKTWNATVVALFLGTSGLPVLLLQVNVHSKGGTPEENNHSLLPLTIAFPPYKKENKKRKLHVWKKLQAVFGAIWEQLFWVLVSSSQICSPLVNRWLLWRWTWWHFMFSLCCFYINFDFLFLYNFIIILRKCPLPSSFPCSPQPKDCFLLSFLSHKGKCFLPGVSQVY